MLRMGNSVKSISELNQIKLKQFSVRVRRIQKIIRIYKIDLKVITFSPVNNINSIVKEDELSN